MITAEWKRMGLFRKTKRRIKRQRDYIGRIEARKQAGYAYRWQAEKLFNKKVNEYKNLTWYKKLIYWIKGKYGNRTDNRKAETSS
jgi:hypothetical protein